MTRPVVAIDVGGTFTDCVAWTPEGVAVTKVPTTAAQGEGVVEGARRLLGERTAAALLHGTTVATNALLEGKGARVVLVTDPGFEDVIEIGRQDRPSLYDPFADRSPPLVARDARIGCAEPGEVGERVRVLGAESVAVCFEYSFADPAREVEAAAALTGSGVPVSLSHRVVAEFREYERVSTTVLNAYLRPLVEDYLSGLDSRVGKMVDRFLVMRSSGGLMEGSVAAELAVALLLSGPAGGVVAAAELGRARGYDRIVSFDMGGTSTDVCRIEGGRPRVDYERRIGGYPARMPSVAVHTVGAGGGSLAWVDAGGALRVGPRSAGANPGPAAYGKGGEGATVTDAQVALGRIHPGSRLGGEVRLDPGAALRALARVGDPLGMGPEQVAAGMIEVVDAHMERAMRAVSVEEGSDPRRATLVAFGGAGGLHAGTLARRLEMERVAIPPHAGVFSALGLLLAAPRLDHARSVLGVPLEDVDAQVRMVGEEAAGEFGRVHGNRPAQVSAGVDMRYVGQSHEISVPVTPGEPVASVIDRFHRIHADLNGFARRDVPVEVVTFRAAAEGRPRLSWSDLPSLAEGPLPEPQRSQGGVAVWQRSRLPAGARLVGPAVIEEPVGTSLLAEGDVAVVAEDGTIEVTW